MKTPSNHVFNKLLRQFKPKSPVVFTFHLNWKVYENIGVEQFNHVKNHFRNNGIPNIELLPILTDKKTYLDKRIKQFKNGLEKIVDKYDSKAHVVGYSFAGIIPRGYIGIHGDDYIHSLLTIGTPNKGSGFVDRLISKNFDDRWYVMEPGIRNTNVHRDWLMDEYSSKTMYDFNNNYGISSKVQYSSVGGRRDKLKCSESLRYISDELMGDLYNDNPNDGIICTKENEFGKHIINFDADHFELIGMRPNYNPAMLFELYANNVKNNDPDFNSTFTDIEANVASDKIIEAINENMKEDLQINHKGNSLI